MSLFGLKTEHDDLLKFIVKKAESVTSPFNLRQLCREFKTKNGSGRSAKQLADRIGRYRERIHELPDVDNVTKVKMMFAVKAPVDGEFLELMKKSAEVEVDERNRILKYRSFDGRVLLAIEDRYIEENKEFIKLLREESKTANSPINLSALCQKFKELWKSNTAKSVFLEKIIKYRQKIPEMKELDLDEKARMLFALSAPIDPDFLKKLQWESYVEVDHLNRIVKYQSEKGLKLCGIHFFQDETFKAAVDKKTKKTIKKK
ncbi:hypothetical protein CRE_28678 [Caenorhabditis remanei]|uniref:Uncharacterized protein n=1 Tax=Caenorhabditis remanei TaxID=31234 RepID=E3MJZ2_CAERE|nr:hypothetical protein CRE_28678 [Caenorhabditis remanei]